DLALPRPLLDLPARPAGARPARLETSGAVRRPGAPAGHLDLGPVCPLGGDGPPVAVPPDRPGAPTSWHPGDRRLRPAGPARRQLPRRPRRRPGVPPRMAAPRRPLPRPLRPRSTRRLRRRPLRPLDPRPRPPRPTPRPRSPLPRAGPAGLDARDVRGLGGG